MNVKKTMSLITIYLTHHYNNIKINFEKKSKAIIINLSLLRNKFFFCNGKLMNSIGNLKREKNSRNTHSNG